MAASSFINGFGGSISFATHTMVVESWSLTIKADALETTHTGSAGWEEFILGAKGWEGSCKANLDIGNTPTVNFAAGLTGTLLLPLGGQVSNYTGSALITQVAVENAAKGVVTYNISFKGNGALTLPT